MFYKQVEDAAMRSPVSSIIDKTGMKQFEEKAVRTAENPLGYGEGVWKISS